MPSEYSTCPVADGPLKEMTAEIFPAGFPEELKASAYISGSEAAWPIEFAGKVVDWFGQNKVAVLGTEAWTVHKDGTITPSIEGGLYGNAVSEKRDESWDAYVRRACTRKRCVASSL